MYHFNQGTLDVGAEWQDKSIILLTNDSGQSISVSYDKLPFGMDFLEFCDREITSLSHQLTDYQEISRKEDELDGHKCIFSEYKWHSPQGKLQQITVIIDMPTNYPLMITVTSVVDLTDKQKAILLSIVRSFKVRTEQ